VWNSGMTNTLTTQGRESKAVTATNSYSANTYLRLTVCVPDDARCAADATCDGDNAVYARLCSFEFDGRQYRRLLRILPLVQPLESMPCMRVQCTGGQPGDCCTNLSLMDMDRLVAGTEFVIGPLGLLPDVIASPPLLMAPRLLRASNESAPLFRFGGRI
jgi:hypothetical protein